MLQNININLPSTAPIQPYLTSMRSFLGKTWQLIQLFPEKAQDLRIAYVSLALVSAAAYQIALLASNISNRIIPSDGDTTSRWEDWRACINWIVGVSTTLLVIKVFLDFAKLPISREKILCVCATVLTFRLFLEARTTN
jgi:hypothetical protein